MAYRERDWLPAVTVTGQKQGCDGQDSIASYRQWDKPLIIVLKAVRGVIAHFASYIQAIAEYSVRVEEGIPWRSSDEGRNPAA